MNYFIIQNDKLLDAKNLYRESINDIKFPWFDLDPIRVFLHFEEN